MYFISDNFNDFSGIIPKDFFARYSKKSINIQWQITLKNGRLYFKCKHWARRQFEFQGYQNKKPF